MTKTEYGLRPIRTFLRGAPSLRGSLLSKHQGGTKLTRGFVEIVKERFTGRSVEAMFEECQGAASFRQALNASHTAQTRIRDFQPDLVVLSVDADLLASTGKWGDDLAQTYEVNMLEAIQVIKSELGSRVIVLNASSVVPDERVSNFRRVEGQPLVLDINRLNLATMSLSLQEGISIVDVDRIIAELGAAEHVLGFLDYSPAACEAICSEFVRVIEDYGFFDSRPILPQVGRASSDE